MTKWIIPWVSESSDSDVFASIKGAHIQTENASASLASTTLFWPMYLF